jgi:hypothetical protein
MNAKVDIFPAKIPPIWTARCSSCGCDARIVQRPHMAPPPTSSRCACGNIIRWETKKNAR